MKHYFILFLFFLNACHSSSHKESCSISIVLDVTDLHILQPQSQPILELFDFGENKNASANFRYSEIRDITLVPVTTFTLPDEATTERRNKKNEPLFREKLILNFYDSIRNTLSRTPVQSNSSFLNHSECFKTISNELNVLAQNQSSKRILIAFSNLFENSQILSVYSKNNKNLLYINPEETKKIFQNTHLLPDHLKGITIVFVYEPKNRKEDRVFNAMAEVYKSLLHERGAQVFVQANNNSYQLSAN